MLRVTNNMITANTKTNINGNKFSVDKYNTQMTTQKKISRPSDDPVVAIRSLRLSTSLNRINQYVDRNIPDAESWLSVTETALSNMKSLLTDVRTLCVNGSTDTLTAEDRHTLLKQMTALAEQVYTEGNSDYAGRTVFTGYKSGCQLTFGDDISEQAYQIDQKFTYEDLEAHRYYSGNVIVPTSLDDGNCTVEVGEHEYHRIRLGYDELQTLDSLTFRVGEEEVSVRLDQDEESGASGSIDIPASPLSEGASCSIRQVDNLGAWNDLSLEDEDMPAMEVGDDEILFVRATGELIFGKNAFEAFKKGEAELDVSYTKKGFKGTEARPEYYYDCRDITNVLDPSNEEEMMQDAIVYTKANQEINFTVSMGVDLTVNTQTSQIFDTSIRRDIYEMVDIISKCINAHDKVDNIKHMMQQTQYQDEAAQAQLQTYLDAAKKEADYADDNLQQTFNQYITNFDDYLNRINTGITNLGSTSDRLELTKVRVQNQQTVYQGLKSSNEDREISDIIIDYTAAHNAYQSSLQAASKLNQNSLLDYI